MKILVYKGNRNELYASIISAQGGQPSYSGYFTPGEQTWVPIRREGGWVSDAVWTTYKQSQELILLL
jgi:hypothetical protein